MRGEGGVEGRITSPGVPEAATEPLVMGKALGNRKCSKRKKILTKRDGVGRADGRISPANGVLAKRKHLKGTPPRP